MSRSPKILVAGDGWAGALFAARLNALGQETELWLSDTDLRGPEAVYEGNGETREKAGLIFGEDLAARIWEVSQANFATAKTHLKELGVAFHADNSAFSFSPSKLLAALQAGLPTPTRFHRLESVRADGLDTRLVFSGPQGKSEACAPLVVLVTEAFEQAAVPWLADKRIPVTLSSFIFPPSPAFKGSLSVFNGGADFAVSDGAALRLGSYRNLFQDHGVGLHDAVDPRTRDGVLKFFSAQGWIAPQDSFRSELRIESISCDGLPLVGTVPGLAGAVFITGFAARGACFLFEVADRVARSVTGASKSDLDVFTPRRLL